MESGFDLTSVRAMAHVSGKKIFTEKIPHFDSLTSVIEAAKFHNIKPYHSGESYDNLLKIFYLLGKYPDVSLFVQTNPGFCCPSLVTEAMKADIQRITGVPIVTITYDGTSESKNELVIPYIKLLKEKKQITGELVLK